eukprot:TRINITY_DN778_c1_g1_i1.p1 TRINITY_DN778_c1_g1~~TRINITY_DN778_c1_g1_i1.p1  ORF type:complete len:543 (+),score=67.87 TRINITY_DN778_c1_g1_i1:111-1739(+)
MEDLPSETKAIIGSFLDDRSRRVMRLASTQWFNRIRYNDFVLYFTTEKQVPQILTKLGRYASPLSITFRKPKCTLTKQNYEAFGQLTQLRKLILDNAIRNDFSVEDLHPLTNLTNLEEIDRHLPAEIMRHFVKVKKINFTAMEQVQLLDLPRFSKLEEVDWYPQSLADPPTADPLLIVHHTQHVTKLAVDSVPRDTIDERNLTRYPNLKDLSILDFSGSNKRFDMPYLPNLEFLNLRTNNIGSLAPVHEKLTNLLAQCRRLDCSSLESLTKLQMLYLEWSLDELTIADLQVLTALTNLESLNLCYYNYNFNQTDWNELFQFVSSNLTALEVREFECNLDHITKFGNLQSLEVIKFSGDASQLGTLSNLTNLIVGDAQPEIFSAIETLTKLKRLEIDNRFGNDLDPSNAIPFHIGKLSALEKLSFSYEGARIDENEMQHLPLTSLVIGWKVNANFLEIAAKLTGLDTLALRNAAQISDESLKQLSSLSNLTDLSMRQAVIRAADVTLLTSLQCLQIQSAVPLAYTSDDLKNILPQLYTCYIIQ